MERFQQIRTIINEIEEDVNKFYDKENQAAGTRIRKAMQEVKELAQQVRTEVQGIKNSRS